MFSYTRKNIIQLELSCLRIYKQYSFSCTRSPVYHTWKFIQIFGHDKKSKYLFILQGLKSSIRLRAKVIKNISKDLTHLIIIRYTDTYIAKEWNLVVVVKPFLHICTWTEAYLLLYSLYSAAMTLTTWS